MFRKPFVRATFVLSVLTMGTVALVAWQVFRAESAWGQRRLRSQVDLSNYQPRQVVSPFPAITSPQTAPRTEAEAVLNPQDLVLGVVLAGQARAYPINQLTGPSREIFNDQLGGQSIAATW